VGELCFPAAVAVLFVLSRADVLTFSIPILVLTFADPAAALVGMRYGRLRYRVVAGEKSLEGSAAFCVVATACIAIPLLLVLDIQTAAAVTLSMSLALLLTLVEAVSCRGLDNLFVPLAGFLGLKALLAAAGVAGAIPWALTQG
jgi:phytol kinase